MAVIVQFPDGSQREVASQLCPIDPTAVGTQVRFRQVPINCDPQWRYVRVAATWHAIARHGALAILLPPVDDWWQGIEAMDDAAPSDASRAA
ncbi:hypothetical protein [Sphingobium sp.]|uniref:hypothetical protein n=1 Tax=Sphingobium sp. TaxID=1912891 RepID=UPI003B3B78BA